MHVVVYDDGVAGDRNLDRVFTLHRAPQYRFLRADGPIYLKTSILICTVFGLFCAVFGPIWRMRDVFCYFFAASAFLKSLYFLPLLMFFDSYYLHFDLIRTILVLHFFFTYFL